MQDNGISAPPIQSHQHNHQCVFNLPQFFRFVEGKLRELLWPSCLAAQPEFWSTARQSNLLALLLFLGHAARMPDEETQCGALLIAASLIAAIRLRGEPIQPSPKLKATIYDSVQLAVLVWRELQ
jgi:hypothetical protein